MSVNRPQEKGNVMPGERFAVIAKWLPISNKMMKQLFNGSVVCFLISVVSFVSPSFGGEVDYEAAKAFYADYLKFDYCGTNGIVRTERGEPHEKVLQAMVHFRPEVVQRDKCFYEMLRRFEVSALTGKVGRHRDGIEIGRWLLVLRKQEKQQGALWNYVSSVDYSLLRILDSGLFWTVALIKSA